MTLIPHLGHDARLLGGSREDARFVNRIGERLLHIDVLSCLHRHVGDDGMGVIGRGDDDRVDVLLLLEHLPEVGVFRRFGVDLLELS